MDIIKNKKFFGPFIIVVVLFFLFLAGLLKVFNAGISETTAGTFGDSFGVLNSLFSGLGFAAVVVTLWQQQQQIDYQAQERAEEVEERRSLFNLQASEEAYRQAQQILSEQNHDRVTWIRAGRLLRHAKELGAGVTVKEHQRVLEYRRLEYRSFFHQLLESKPAEFYYGVPESDSLDEAARASSAPANESELNSLRQFDETSIHAVWETAQWPENYVDPLGESFSPEERARMIFGPSGLREFLDHTDSYHSIGGQLFERNREN